MKLPGPNPNRMRINAIKMRGSIGPRSNSTSRSASSRFRRTGRWRAEIVTRLLPRDALAAFPFSMTPLVHEQTRERNRSVRLRLRHPSIWRLTMNKLSLLSAGAGLALAALPVSFNWSPANVKSLSILSLDTAEARVGRPLTPVSVAGVSRRASRRAYRREYYGTGPGYVAPGAVAAGAVAAGAVAAGAATTGAAPIGAAPAGPAPVYPAEGPSFVSDAMVVPPGASATVVDPATGRRCTISTDGYHWCWTP